MIDTLYILSAGRSGSTLLNLVLGSHRRAVAVSELTQLPFDIIRRNTCTCSAPIGECRFWLEVGRYVHAELGIDLWREPEALNLGCMVDPRRRNERPVTNAYALTWKLRHGLVYLDELGFPVPRALRREFDQGVSNTVRVHDIIRRVSGRDVVVDASKSYLKGVALYRKRPQNTRLILLSRNGRASFYSRLRDGYGRNQSMKAWRNYYRHALPLLDRRVPPEHVIRVKYEDLATDPAREIDRICAFAGLPSAPGMLDFNAAEHHVTSGNDMRMQSGMRIHPDTSWQKGLAPADERYFELWAGTTNRRLGY
jgi:hypothetical protein